MNDWMLIFRELSPTIPYIMVALGALWCLYTNMGSIFPWRGKLGIEKVEIPLLSKLLGKMGIELFISVDWFRLNLVVNFPLTIAWFIVAVAIAICVAIFPAQPVDRELAIINATLSFLFAVMLGLFWRRDLLAAKATLVSA